ncbi:MAG: hypothetical protein ACJ8CR_05685 [Roseiflexaceae bacterium]
MSERLQPILALLDEGIAIYRRNFARFVLISALWFVPVAIAVGALIAAGPWLDTGPAILIGLAGLLLLFPLAIYLVGGLSRAAAAAIDGRPPRFREALAIRPLRAAGMGCFALVYMLIAQIASYVISLICICPLYLVGLLLVGGVSSLTNATEELSLFLGVIFLLVLLAGYAFALVAGGAVYSSLIYALQPWAQESRPFGETFQRSLDMVGYRFWHNLLVWGLTALLVAAIGLTVTVTIGVLLPLPLSFALGSESPIMQAITASAWLIGFVVVLPPLPIWMALFYRRNRAAREGADLDAEVRGWWGEHFGEPGAEDRR